MLSGHSERVTGGVFHPDGKSAFTVSRDHTVRVWDVSSGKCVETLVKHSGPVTAVAISSDGTALATTGNDSKVMVWGVADRKRTTTIDLDEERLQGLLLLQPPEGHGPKDDDPDDDRGSLQVVGAIPKVGIRFWNATSAECLRTIPLTCNVTSLAASRDGDLLLAGCDNNSVKAFHTWTGVEIATMHGHDGTLLTVDVDERGSLALSASGDRSLKLWRLWGNELPPLNPPAPAKPKDGDREW